MIQPNARNARIESHKAEPVQQSVRLHDLQFGRQTQFENSTERSQRFKCKRQQHNLEEPPAQRQRMYDEYAMPSNLPGVKNYRTINNAVPEILPAAPVSSALPSSSLANEISSRASIAPAAPPINFDDLFQKLLSAGLINNNAVKAETKDKPQDRPRTISLSDPESLKLRQQNHIIALFSGMQCSNCDARFPPEQTIKYSQHLDWHFRQNRRDRDSKRRAQSRGWYYNVNDWIQYEEIENLDERKMNWFEMQQMNMAKDDSAQRTESPPVPSCVAGPEDAGKTCEMCHDQFETFYDDENEDWHFRNAIRVDDKTYHPICFEDCNKPSSVSLDETSIPLKAKTTDDSGNPIVDHFVLSDSKLNFFFFFKFSVDIILLHDDDDVTEIARNGDDVPAVTSGLLVENVVSTPQDGASTSSGTVTSSTTNDDDVKKGTYEWIGNGSDLLVLQIAVVDVEDYEDKDDGFEDIGTFEEAAFIEDNSGEFSRSCYCCYEA